MSDWGVVVAAIIILILIAVVGGFGLILGMVTAAAMATTLYPRLADAKERTKGRSEKARLPCYIIQMPV